MFCKGSHDSLTYTIKRFNDVGPDESRVVQFFGRYFGLLVKPIIFNWAVTQKCTIESQLNGGVRYFDLRLAGKPGTDSAFFIHGLYGCEVDQPLQVLYCHYKKNVMDIFCKDAPMFQNNYMNIFLNLDLK